MLDEGALSDALRDDPDAALSLLADLVGATDTALRTLALRLAGRIFIDVASRGGARTNGVGRLADVPYRPDGGDLDLDASLDAVVERGRGAVDPERLRVRGWVRPETAICLLVDRSGSMGGAPLATAALAAAAVSARATGDYSVVSFGKDAIVVKSQLTPKPAEAVITDVLSLRGFGTTDLAVALHTAREQLLRSRAGRKVTLLLSDCRCTVDGDPHAAARTLDELVVVAPASDAEEAEAFAARVGARWVTVEGPADVAEAVTRALSR